jgi:hypothetical protein
MGDNYLHADLAVLDGIAENDATCTDTKSDKDIKDICKCGAHQCDLEKEVYWVRAGEDQRLPFLLPKLHDRAGEDVREHARVFPVDEQKRSAPVDSDVDLGH